MTRTLNNEPPVRTAGRNPGHVEISEWLDAYDPKDFNIFLIQVAVGRMAARRNAAAKRINKPVNDRPRCGLHRMATAYLWRACRDLRLITGVVVRSRNGEEGH